MDMLDHKNVMNNEKVLNNDDLQKIEGGSVSGTLINAFTSGMKVILDIGRNLGAALRRIKEGKMCEVL